MTTPVNGQEPAGHPARSGTPARPDASVRPLTPARPRRTLTSAWARQPIIPGPPPELALRLAVLRATLPGYQVHLIERGDGTWSFEAIRQHDGPGPWCLISASAAEIYTTIKNQPPHS